MFQQPEQQIVCRGAPNDADPQEHRKQLNFLVAP
jgi:hypothetical protein